MGNQYVANAAKTALSASATKSMVLLNPAGNGVKIVEVGISFDGSAAAAAIQVDLYRVVTIGSAGGNSFTPLQLDPGSSKATADTTALTVLTTEPTTVSMLFSWFVSPNSGIFVIQYPMGREPVAVAGGARVGIRAVTPAGVTPNCLAYMVWEE